MSRTTLLSVAVLSAAILGYEVLLVRLYSIVSWYHFAYMVISIALLGFGASGTALALAQDWLLPRFATAFAAGAVLFAAAAVGSFAAAIRLPFNPLAIVWDLHQLLWLALSYLTLVLPFFFGGGAIGLALTRFSGQAGRVYAWDLAGAGLGAFGMIGVLFVLPPEATLRLVAALGLLAAALALWPRGRLVAGGLAVAALGMALWLPPALTDLRPHISEYKGLPLALRAPDARVIDERSSPLGLLSVVESPVIPFRHVPGLSLVNTLEPPPQLAVFTDGDAMTTITRFDGDRGALRYLDFTTAALPYHLLQRPEVLVPGAGGGEQLLLALYHRAARIDAVELNPQLGALLGRHYADFAGDLLARPEVALHLAEARSFVERSGRRYDLIQLPLQGSAGASAAGTFSLNESYVLTVEALEAYLARLRPGGLFAATLWLKLPPRDSLKLFASALRALERQGVERPGERAAMIRSWNTVTLVAKNGAFTPADIGALREFARARSFDLVWYPGMREEEANRHNILSEPWVHRGARALAGPGREAFVAAYKFAIEPATDDRPYFHDFFRWRSLPELLALGPQGAAALLDMGYLILFATLVQAALMSALLILAPLAVLGGVGGRDRGWTVAFFLAIGLGFLFIEIAAIQRFVLFLGHPLYAVAVVLAGFLVFAGAGSAFAPRLERAMAGRRLGGAEAAALGVAALTALYIAVLPPLLQALIWLPIAIKIPLVLALIVPLAALMGMPFPLGLARLARRSPALVPWAWGINGCASVIAAILATLLAIHWGFAAVMGLAALLYLSIPLFLRRSAGD